MTTQNQFQNHHHVRRWFVVLSAALFFCYQFVQMQMFNSISGNLMREFHLNATQLGNLSATYLYADVLFLLPAGILLDRFSTRAVILLALMLSLFGTVGFALSTNLWQASCWHFLTGIGAAFCFLSCIRLASRWFPSNRLAFVIGLIITVAMAGGLLAQIPFTVLERFFPWREVVLFSAGFGVIVFLLILINVQSYPPGYTEQHQRQDQQLKNIGFYESISICLCNKQNWLSGIYAGLLNLPIMLIGALWGNLYLQQIHHLSAIEASTVVSMIFIGTIVGAPILGSWSDQICLRKFPMIIGAILSTIAVLVFIEFHYLDYKALLILFFFIGFFTSAQVLAYPVVTESNNRIVTSTATALTSMLIMGGAALFQPLFGIIMDSFWTGITTGGMNIYSDTAFYHAMMILPVTFVIAIICACFINETHCREVNSKHQTKVA